VPPKRNFEAERYAWQKMRRLVTQPRQLKVCLGSSKTSHEVVRLFAAHMEKRDTKAEQCRLKSSHSSGVRHYSVELGLL